VQPWKPGTTLTPDAPAAVLLQPRRPQRRLSPTAPPLGGPAGAGGVGSSELQKLSRVTPPATIRRPANSDGPRRHRERTRPPGPGQPPGPPPRAPPANRPSAPLRDGYQNKHSRRRGLHRDIGDGAT